MFGKRKQQRIMSMIQAYRPTSKSALKQYCLLVARGNVDEATKYYDFFISGMEDLPMFDPPPTTWLDNTKNTITGIADLIKDNKDGLAQAYELLRGIMSARGKNLPALTATAEDVATPLETIN